MRGRGGEGERGGVWGGGGWLIMNCRLMSDCYLVVLKRDI